MLLRRREAGGGRRVNLRLTFYSVALARFLKKQASCRKVLELLKRGIMILPMAQGLHLSQKMTLSQVLAPQLQQSLALLQAPTLELKAMVEQELQQNPVLEEVEESSVSLEEIARKEDKNERVEAMWKQ